MRGDRFSRVALAAILLAGNVLAQDLRPESLESFGGVYSPDCKDPAAAQVRIAASGLEISRGSKRVSTPVRMDSFTSFGAAPTSPVPEGYRIEFIGDDFSLYVFADGQGLLVPLEGYTPAAEAVMGKAGVKARFGRCRAR